MTLTLVRLDDRLIHGQVVIGWVQAMGIEKIVVIDDHVRANEWEQDIYRLGVPDGLGVEFTSVEEAQKRVTAWCEAPERIVLLVGDVRTMACLCESDGINKVNVGGVHDAPGRRQRLPYVFLTDDEAVQLRALHDHGVEVTAQAVPTERPHPIGEVIR